MTASRLPAGYWRERAEEIRAAAQSLYDPVVKASWERMAETCDKMAGVAQILGKEEETERP